MSGVDFRDAFFAFLEKPTRESYLAVHAMVTSAPAYDPYAQDIPELEALYESGDAAGTCQLARALVTKWLLTPRVHFLLAFASRRLGDMQTFQVEGPIATLCIQGILSTGDGSEAQPWIVTCTYDEYDVLLHIGRYGPGRVGPSRQSLVHRGGASLDRMDFPDGTALWFDVTAPYQALQRKLTKV